MTSLFAPEELQTYWEQHWWQMPEYSHEDLEPVKQIIVSFASEDELAIFSDMLGQKVLMTTRSVWFSPQEIGTYRNKSYE